MNTTARPQPPEEPPYYGSWLSDHGVWHPDTPAEHINYTHDVMVGKRRPANDQREYDAAMEEYREHAAIANATAEPEREDWAQPSIANIPVKPETEYFQMPCVTDFAHHPKSEMPETAEEPRMHERVWVRGLSIQQFQTQIHDWAVGKGFWEEREESNWADIFQDTSFVLSKLMLAVTELSEAGEACRIGDFINFKEELADAVIRLFDTADAMDIDLAAEMVAKMKRNEQRPYKHGKRA